MSCDLQLLKAAIITVGQLAIFFFFLCQLQKVQAELEQSVPFKAALALLSVIDSGLPSDTFVFHSQPSLKEEMGHSLYCTGHLRVMVRESHLNKYENTNSSQRT